MGRTRFELVHIDEEQPDAVDGVLSDPVMVFTHNEEFIGEDTWNAYLKRWLISRDTAKMWLKRI